METRRWTNPSQPQTLYIAVILLYVNAAMSLLFGGFLSIIGLLLIVGDVAAGLGIANEKRWGYLLGVGVASIGVLFAVGLPVVLDGVGALLRPAVLIGAIFPVALFALLVHPMSRDYQRVWFK